MKLTIASIFRNESLYLREFIEFHLIQGVERFYLFDNRSDDYYLSVLQPYIDKGIVELTIWPYYPPCQCSAYQHYIDAHRGASEWCIFVDIDEFLWSPKYNTVTEALDIFPAHWQAVAVNWMCFGSSGKQEWEDAPVIERFTWRRPADLCSNNLVKPIVRMNQHFTIGNPHFADLPTVTPSGKESFGGNVIPHEHDILRINHYGTKSRQEWVKRQLLGKPCAASSPSPEACYQEVQGDGLHEGDLDDREIQRILPELKERLSK